MAVCPEQQKIKVNIHNTIPLLIRESDLMAKMDLPIPMVALTLYAKRDHFTLVQDSLQVLTLFFKILSSGAKLLSFQFLVVDFLKVVKSVKMEIRPLFLPHLVKLVNIVAPGLKELTWVSSGWKTFVDTANEAVQNFKVLVSI